MEINGNILRRMAAGEKICRFCKGRHLAEEHFCQDCKNTGHPEEYCPKHTSIYHRPSLQHPIGQNPFGHNQGNHFMNDDFNEEREKMRWLEQQQQELRRLEIQHQYNQRRDRQANDLWHINLQQEFPF